MEPGGLFAPRRERLGAHDRACVLAQDGQVFAQIGARGELGDGFVASAHGRRVRRRLQPGRQRRLAHPGARDAQQLEERRRPEQIQIARVQVLVVEEAIAGLATGPGPAAVQPRERALVERDGAAEARPRDQRAFEPAADPDIGRRRREQPPAGEQPAGEGEVRRDQAGDERGQAPVSERDVLPDRDGERRAS